MFLSEHDLQELTGCRHKSHQAAWLRDRGWVFELTRTGHPRVALAYFNERMGTGQQSVPRTAEPNFKAPTT